MFRFRHLPGLLLCVAPLAHAFDFDWQDTQFSLKSKYTAGAAWRLQDPNQALLGKLNVPGQQNLCASDNCISLRGDPGPNQRLVNALGSYSGVNSDDGDINYKRYDVVAATNKLSLDLTGTHGNLVGRVRAIGYYDPVNADFNTFHNDTNYQPAFTKRSDQQAGVYAKGARLYDAFLQYSTDWNGRTVTATVGQQSIRWGESNLLAINSISEINPPNANFLHMPGGEINEIFQPVPAALFSTDVVDGVTADLLYQFGWKKVQPDASGSFYSSSDIAGRGNIADITLGQFPEDPNRKFRFAGALGLISSSSTTVYPYEVNPGSQGNYGVKLNYNAEWLNGGTELGFYALNYTSRFPYASVIAANDSCARSATNAATALINCNGFKGTLLNLPNGKEPLPIDTMKVLLEYPKDIHMFGVSFNTNALGMSFSGEYSYRPNIPMQVQLTDVIYAGLQPAFPAQDIVADPTSFNGAGSGLIGALGGLASLGPSQIAGLQELGASTLPSAQHAIPSYLVTYRNLGRVAANQYIAGYQRMGMGQFDLTGIKIWSSNPFGADQIILLSEAGFQHIVGMPRRDQLQLEGGNASDSHASGGADGSGLTAANSCNNAITGSPSDYTCHLNPHQQTTGFATAFAWGIRTLAKLEYNDVIFGWGLRPTVGFNWDISGTAPAPTQNFVEGRMEFTLGTDINITPALMARLMYLGYAGGRPGENVIADRDNIALSFSYTF